MMDKQEERSGVKVERPNFGNRQVRNVTEILWGNKYICHSGDGISSIITLLERMGGNSVWMKVVRTGSGCITDYSLADYGVIPYETGLWNKTNWIERMEE